MDSNLIAATLANVPFALEDKSEVRLRTTVVPMELGFTAIANKDRQKLCHFQVVVMPDILAILQIDYEKKTLSLLHRVTLQVVDSMAFIELLRLSTDKTSPHLIKGNLNNKKASTILVDNKILPELASRNVVGETFESWCQLSIYFMGRLPMAVKCTSPNQRDQICVRLQSIIKAPMQRVNEKVVIIHHCFAKRQPKYNPFWKDVYLVFIPGRILEFDHQTSPIPREVVSVFTKYLPVLDAPKITIGRLTLEENMHPLVYKFESDAESVLAFNAILVTIELMEYEDFFREEGRKINGVNGSVSSRNSTYSGALPTNTFHARSSTVSTMSNISKIPNYGGRQRTLSSVHEVEESPTNSNSKKGTQSMGNLATKDLTAHVRRGSLSADTTPQNAYLLEPIKGLSETSAVVSPGTKSISKRSSTFSAGFKSPLKVDVDTASLPEFIHSLRRKESMPIIPERRDSVFSVASQNIESDAERLNEAKNIPVSEDEAEEDADSAKSMNQFKFVSYYTPDLLEIVSALESYLQVRASLESVYTGLLSPSSTLLSLLNFQVVVDGVNSTLNIDLKTSRETQSYILKNITIPDELKVPRTRRGSVETFPTSTSFLGLGLITKPDFAFSGLSKDTLETWSEMVIRFNDFNKEINILCATPSQRVYIKKILSAISLSDDLEKFKDQTTIVLHQCLVNHSVGPGDVPKTGHLVVIAGRLLEYDASSNSRIPVETLTLYPRLPPTINKTSVIVPKFEGDTIIDLSYEFGSEVDSLAFYNSLLGANELWDVIVGNAHYRNLLKIQPSRKQSKSALGKLAAPLVQATRSPRPHGLVIKVDGTRTPDTVQSGGDKGVAFDAYADAQNRSGLKVTTELSHSEYESDASRGNPKSDRSAKKIKNMTPRINKFFPPPAPSSEDPASSKKTRTIRSGSTLLNVPSPDGKTVLRVPLSVQLNADGSASSNGSVAKLSAESLQKANKAASYFGQGRKTPVLSEESPKTLAAPAHQFDLLTPRSFSRFFAPPPAPMVSQSPSKRRNSTQGRPSLAELAPPLLKSDHIPDAIVESDTAETIKNKLDMMTPRTFGKYFAPPAAPMLSPDKKAAIHPYKTNHQSERLHQNERHIVVSNERNRFPEALSEEMNAIAGGFSTIPTAAPPSISNDKDRQIPGKSDRRISFSKDGPGIVTFVHTHYHYVTLDSAPVVDVPLGKVVQNKASMNVVIMKNVATVNTFVCLINVSSKMSLAELRLFLHNEKPGLLNDSFRFQYELSHLEQARENTINVGAVGGVVFVSED